MYSRILSALSTLINDYLRVKSALALAYSLIQVRYCTICLKTNTATTDTRHIGGYPDITIHTGIWMAIIGSISGYATIKFMKRQPSV
ncbi:hypothetical protein BJX62DRAFT_231655 [Aspergillus germanicus]